VATQIDTLGRNVYAYHSIVVDSSENVWTLYRTYSTTYRMMLFKNETQMEDVADDDIHGTGETMFMCTMCIDSSDVIHIFCSASPGGATRDLAYATYTISTSTLSSWTEIVSYKTAYTSNSLQCAINSNDDIFVMYGYNPKNGQVFMVTDESGSWVEYELGSDGKSYVYQGGGIGIDGNDDIWFHYRNTTSALSCYRIWDSSASSLGSEQTQSAPSGTTNYYPIQDVVYNGSNVYFWWHPFQTITGEEPWKQTIDSGSFTNNPCTVEEDDFWRISRSGSSGNFTYWNGKLAYVGSYYGYQGIALYTLETGGWTYQYDIGGPGQTNYEDHQVRCATPNSTPSSNLGSNLYYVFTRYDTTASDWYPYIDVIYPGTPTDDNQKAFTFGGGTPSDDTPAYMLGGPPRGVAHAFLDGGYDVGGNTRSAVHVSVPTKPPNLPAYLEGDLKFYFDVVPFNCNTGTGTQNITGSLGGNQPAMAFFTGSGTTSDHVMTADCRFFFGWTDGTDEYCVRAYLPDEQGSSAAYSGTVSSSACAGSSYGVGGSAEFNSWLTNGVQLNWTAGADVAWDAAALLVACDNNSVGIQTASGSINPEAIAETGDTIDVEGLGFTPDMVITFIPQGGCGVGMGVAGYDANGDWKRGCISKDWNSGYFNWPSSATISKNTTYIHWNVADGEESGADSVGQWATLEPENDNLFQFYCYGNDGVYDLTTFYWIAFKLEPPGKVKWDYHVYSDYGTPGNYDYDMNMNVDAVVGFLEQYGDVNSPSHYGTFGGQMFDGSDEFSCCNSTITGGSPWVAKCVGDTTKLGVGIVQKDGPTLQGTADFVQWNTSGWRAYIDSTGGDGTTICRTRSICFGNNYPTSSKVSAYMRGHSHIQFAHTWGQQHTTDSKSAFFYVVDAQDYKHSYMEGLNPSRSSASGYTAGFDNPMIVPVEFTLTNASGNFDITDPIFNGNQPKAAIFWLFGATEHEATGINEDALVSMGFTDGVNQYCLAARAKDGTTGFPQSGSWSDENVMIVPNADWSSPGRVAEANFSSWITNGVRVTWDNAPGDTYTGVAILFYGSEISVYTNHLDRAGTIPADQAISTVGFEPDFILGFQLDDYEDSTIDANWSDWIYMKMYYAINDNRSPTPTQGIINGWTAGDGYWDMGAEPQQWVHYWGDSWSSATRWESDEHWLKSFDANGFTIRYDKSYAPGTDFDFDYICIKVGGGRKFHMSVQHPDDAMSLVEDGAVHNLSQKPYGAYNIIPEMLWIGSLSSVYYYNYYQNDMTNTSGVDMSNGISFWGNGVKRQYQNELDMIYWDQYSQYKDQLARAYTSLSPNMDITLMDYYEPHEYHTPVTMNYKVVTNGIEITIVDFDETFDTDWAQRPWPRTPWTCPMLVYGIAEWTDSQSAYMKGQKDDWPGRTPRGCYLEGTIAEIPVDDSTPAFMQVGPGSNIPAFVEGYLPTSSTKVAFLHGVDTDLDNQEAFLLGSIDVLDNNECYLKGQADFSGSQEIFLKGVDTDSSSNESYLAGGIIVSSNVSAYLRNGWDTLDNQTAYLAGIESTSSIEAYMNGFSASPTSSKSAYLGGTGPWPFTDDFTGNDEDPWNSAKWISTEEL